jgi:hypothetical protein
LSYKRTVTSIDAQKTSLIDEFGELDRKVAQFAPVAKRHRELREQILRWYDDRKPAQAVTEHGKLFEIQISPRTFQRVIRDMRAVYRALGATVFLKKCKFNLTDFDGLGLSKDLLSEEQIGPRTLKAVALSAPAALKKAA